MSSPLLLACESGKKKALLPACESSVDKKSMNYSVSCRSSATPKKLVINFSSPDEKKEATDLKPMKYAAPNEAKSIDEKIA